MEDKITITDIDYLADLSKLTFTDEEKQVLVKEVGGIIDMLNQCGEINIDSQTEHNVQTLNDLRNDEVQEGMGIEDVFSATSLSRNGYFEVPKVVE